jgi:hypothetical protein
VFSPCLGDWPSHDADRGRADIEAGRDSVTSFVLTPTGGSRRP